MVSRMHQRVLEVSGVLQLAGDPGDVVVADERHRHEASRNSLCRASAWSSSWKLPSFRLLQIAFHSSYWVTESNAASRDACRVVAVDDFADEPRVGELLAHPRQHLRPEPVGNGVGGVEPPAVGAAAQPVHHHVDDVVDDVGIVDG